MKKQFAASLERYIARLEARADVDKEDDDHDPVELDDYRLTALDSLGGSYGRVRDTLIEADALTDDVETLQILEAVAQGRGWLIE